MTAPRTRCANTSPLAADRASICRREMALGPAMLVPPDPSKPNQANHVLAVVRLGFHLSRERHGNYRATGYLQLRDEREAAPVAREHVSDGPMPVSMSALIGKVKARPLNRAPGLRGRSPTAQFVVHIPRLP